MGRRSRKDHTASNIKEEGCDGEMLRKAWYNKKAKVKKNGWRLSSLLQSLLEVYSLKRLLISNSGRVG